MKQLSLALNILLLVLVAVLFYLHFNAQKKPVAVTTTKASTQVASQGRIAYFDLDTLQARYQYFKDAEAQLKSSQQSMTAELGGLEREYQKKMGEWQQKGPSMSQAEADAAQREKARMEQRYQTRRQVLEEALAKKSMEINKDIKLKIEKFLKEYNKDNRYSYILAYMPELIYYRDTTNNITDDLLKGLNESYKKPGTSRTSD
jgi:outer membrane protein